MKHNKKVYIKHYGNNSQQFHQRLNKLNKVLKLKNSMMKMMKSLEKQ